MSRVARIVAPGFPHHITQRGNRTMDVFETDDDRLAYLRFLKKYAAQYNLSVYAYCLMTTPIHLVAVPGDEMALGKALRDAHTVYAMYFNTRTALSGHVWQGRFYSCPLDEAHSEQGLTQASEARRVCPCARELSLFTGEANPYDEMSRYSLWKTWTGGAGGTVSLVERRSPLRTFYRRSALYRLPADWGGRRLVGMVGAAG